MLFFNFNGPAGWLKQIAVSFSKTPPMLDIVSTFFSNELTSGQSPLFTTTKI